MHMAQLGQSQHAGGGVALRGHQCLPTNDDSEYPLWITSMLEEHKLAASV